MPATEGLAADVYALFMCFVKIRCAIAECPPRKYATGDTACTEVGSWQQSCSFLQFSFLCYNNLYFAKRQPTYTRCKWIKIQTEQNRQRKQRETTRQLHPTYICYFLFFLF